MSITQNIFDVKKQGTGFPRALKTYYLEVTETITSQITITAESDEDAREQAYLVVDQNGLAGLPKLSRECEVVSCEEAGAI